jgi:WD40 repeat protein
MLQRVGTPLNGESGCADETLRLWNLGMLMAAEDASETDLNESEASGGAKASPPAGASSRKRVSLVLKSYGGCVKCCCFSASGVFLASGSADNLVRVWRVSDRALLHTLKGHKNWVLALAFSPVEEARFATTSADGSLRLWCLQDASPHSTCKVLKPHKPASGGVRLASSKDVTCCAYNEEGSLLCTGGADKLVRIWSLPDGRCQRVLHGHRGQVNR